MGTPSHSCSNWGNSANPQVYDFCPHPAAIPNNGNLISSDEYHGGPGYSQFLGFHQSFTYDGANRLQNASDSGGWSRTFNYDPYGNMWATNVTGVATGAPSSDVYNGANNQVPNAPYDAAGNLKVVNGNTLFYDAENQQVAVTEPQAYGGGTEQYWFDGSGQRVAKMGPSGTFIYVYDVTGQLIAEYASAATAAAPCSTCYLSTDHLGSPRLVTDENANVMARHDYFPFGEEVPANQVGRDTHFGFGNDTVSQKFTGEMRDNETGEDFFNARMFGSAIGRFTSPDPANAGADLMNPQSWNGYSYVYNNPMNAADPTGLHLVDCSWDGCPGLHNGGGGGAVVDGIEQTVFNTSGLGSNSIAACPKNFCSGFTNPGNGQSTYVQFRASAGDGPQGYQTIAQWKNNSYDFNGQFLNAQQYRQALKPLENGQKTALAQYLSSTYQLDFDMVLANLTFKGTIGGNSDFTMTQTLKSFLPENTFNFSGGGCVLCRDGSAPSAHFDNSSMHLDSYRGGNGLTNTLLHFLVDVLAGHLFYNDVPFSR